LLTSLEENLLKFQPGGVRHEIRPIRMRYFLVFFAPKNINFGRSGCRIFVFLQVPVPFYAVQILCKAVRGIIWLSAGYIIFQDEEFVRVDSRFKGYDLVPVAMLF